MENNWRQSPLWLFLSWNHLPFPLTLPHLISLCAWIRKTIIENTRKWEPLKFCDKFSNIIRGKTLFPSLQGEDHHPFITVILAAPDYGTKAPFQLLRPEKWQTLTCHLFFYNPWTKKFFNMFQSFKNVIRAQPHSFIYLLPVAAFVPQSTKAVLSATIVLSIHATKTIEVI